jgi:hypothetical protein
MLKDFNILEILELSFLKTTPKLDPFQHEFFSTVLKKSYLKRLKYTWNNYEDFLEIFSEEIVSAENSSLIESLEITDGEWKKDSLFYRNLFEFFHSLKYLKIQSYFNEIQRPQKSLSRYGMSFLNCLVELKKNEDGGHPLEILSFSTFGEKPFYSILKFFLTSSFFNLKTLEVEEPMLIDFSSLNEKLN